MKQISYLTDSHIHVGQYNDLYTSPSELKVFLDSVGVESFAVSSTTICNVDYRKVISELKSLETLCGDRMSPVLWIIPSMLTDGGAEMFIESGLVWKCIKIHPQLNPEIWMKNGTEMQTVISIASAMQLPLLIHTGNWQGCHPSQYSQVVEKHPNVVFILAHGRHFDETITMMKQYPNVWVDTAFMPIEHVRLLCDEGLADRILWGTDYPIPKYFYSKRDMPEYYLDLVDQLRNMVSNEDFEKITRVNFYRFFSH